MTLGVYQTSGLVDFDGPESYAATKGRYLSNVWVGLYVNHPEYAEQVNSAATQDQLTTFAAVSKDYYHCALGNESVNECVDKVMQKYDKNDIDKIIILLEVVKLSMPADKVRKVTTEYVEIYDFYTTVLNKRADSLDSFTKDEKEFILDLFAKRYNMTLHHYDWNSFLANAKFMQDNQVFKQVYQKIKQMKDAMNDINSKVFEPDRSETYKNESYSVIKGRYLSNMWVGLYLNHPEFAEKVRAEIPGDLVKMFDEIGVGYYRCALQEKSNTNLCVEKLMTKYSKKDYDNLILLIDVVERGFPAEKIRYVAEEYMEIYNFYKNVLASEPMLLDVFEQDEKDFLMTWVEKRTQLISSGFALNEFVENAKYMRDTDTFKEVYRKVKKMSQVMKKEDLDFTERM